MWDVGDIYIYMMVDVGWLVLGRFLNIINDLDKQQWGWADARANSARWLRVLDLLKRISWLTKPQMMLRICSTLRRASKTEAVFFSFRMTPYSLFFFGSYCQSVPSYCSVCGIYHDHKLRPPERPKLTNLAKYGLWDNHTYYYLI